MLFEGAGLLTGSVLLVVHALSEEFVLAGGGCQAADGALALNTGDGGGEVTAKEACCESRCHRYSCEKW